MLDRGDPRSELDFSPGLKSDGYCSGPVGQGKLSSTYRASDRSASLSILTTSLLWPKHCGEWESLTKLWSPLNRHRT